MIRGAIFDLDGVLLDSMPVWNDLGGQYLRVRGITPEPGLNDILFAMSMEQGAAYLKEHYSLAQSENEILRGIGEMLEHFYFNEVPLKNGARELVCFLKERNIPLAAATSSPRTHVTRALERNGLLDCFQILLTTGELGESKHCPLIYLQAAQALGSVPEETLVFEDSLYALQTAAQAGFYTVGVRDENGEQDQTGLKAAASIYLNTLENFMLQWKSVLE